MGGGGDDHGSMLMIMIVCYLQGGHEDADFVPCPESYLELTNGQATKQVFASTLFYALAVLKNNILIFSEQQIIIIINSSSSSSISSNSSSRSRGSSKN